MPQTVYDVGDPITSRLKLGVAPDGTTIVTVTVTKPDGTTQTGVAGPTRDGATDEYTAQWTADYLGGGDYVAKWTVTGTGAGVQAKVYNVRPIPSARTRVAWAPFLSSVGDYVPRLTIDTTTPGQAVPLGTFSGQTDPTDEQVMRLIDQAISTVAGPLVTVVPALYDLAGAVVSMRAAAAVQRAYARNPQDYAAADALDRRADASYAVLSAANAANADGGAPLAEYAFPDPVPWGDGVPIGSTGQTVFGRWGQDLL
jgi:hypothetical protein